MNAKELLKSYNLNLASINYLTAENKTIYNLRKSELEKINIIINP